MVAFGVMLLLMGWALWALGQRGFAVGSHPFCADCGFNLYGLPEERARCPECGADILAENSIRVGHRRAVKGAMVAGCLIGAFGAGLISMAGIQWWAKWDGSGYKPMAWLMADIDATDATLRTRACAELEHRIHAGTLSPAEMDRLAEKILKLQADMAINWHMRWGDLIQAVHERRGPAGNLPAGMWERYLSQAMQITANVRPRLRMDDPILIAVSCRLRGGTQYGAIRGVLFEPAAKVTLGPLSGEVDARAVPPDVIPREMNWSMLWLPGGERAWPAGISPGPQTMDISITMSAHDAGLSGMAASHKVNFKFPVEVLARNEPSVKLVRTSDVSPDIALEMERSIRLVGTAPRGGSIVIDHQGRLGTILLAGPPICGAFRVVLRQDRREWDLARVMVRPNDAVSVPLNLQVGLEGGPHAGPAEVVCVPEGAMAAGTVDVMQVWGSEVRRAVTVKE